MFLIIYLKTKSLSKKDQGTLPFKKKEKRPGYTKWDDILGKSIWHDQSRNASVSNEERSNPIHKLDWMDIQLMGELNCELFERTSSQFVKLVITN